MKEKRDETIILRLSKTEKNRIYEKMLSMGIRSLSAYIRKMALDGYCLHLDLKELRRMAYLLQMCSNNLNQYAKRAKDVYKRQMLAAVHNCLQRFTFCWGELLQPMGQVVELVNVFILAQRVIKAENVAVKGDNKVFLAAHPVHADPL